ncbi:MAG TPA: hypothetical protein VM536_22325 [Chloroflexia bacterium]|nr:hypothetical protein [Chloroflexia bacterium]
MSTAVWFSSPTPHIPARLRFMLWFLIAFRTRRLRRPSRQTTPGATSAAGRRRVTSHPQCTAVVRNLHPSTLVRAVFRRVAAYSTPAHCLPAISCI